MTRVFIFWAQPLDNASPDIIHDGNEALLPSDTTRREAVVLRVSDVIKHGLRYFEHDGVVATEDGKHFVLELPSAQRDCLGRAAPIVCCGECSSPKGENVGDKCIDALIRFAEQIERGILPAHLDAIRSSFTTLKKKDHARKVRRFAISMVALAIAVVAACWLLSNS